MFIYVFEYFDTQQKIILQLRDIEQYDFEEIGKMLDMNNTAVRVALSRARKAIREQLVKTVYRETFLNLRKKKKIS